MIGILPFSDGAAGYDCRIVMVSFVCWAWGYIGVYCVLKGQHYYSMNIFMLSSNCILRCIKNCITGVYYRATL
jgi:hypothetical protein